MIEKILLPGSGILFLNKLLPSTISHTKSDSLLNAKLTAVKIFIIQQIFCKTTQKVMDYGRIKKILLHHYGSSNRFVPQLQTYGNAHSIL